jgi:anti-sigma factor RsiW
MTCAESEILLHALIDGELDAGHARQIEAHVAKCERCAAQLISYRDMRQVLRGTNLRYAAPASLRRNIDRSFPSQALTNRRTFLKGLGVGGLASAAAAAGVALLTLNQESDETLVTEAVSAHLRSLQAEHLVDVLSTDRHTVKPWFNGRLDVAPPVIDLTAQGFTLIGGRLDYINGKAVAAIVYRRRAHIINLFVAQSMGSALQTPRLESVQGFNVRRWTSQGLNLLAVSDINSDELEEFGRKFEAAAGSVS